MNLNTKKILEHANRNLKQHPEYESWMLFDGANVSPTGVIVPTFKTKDGKSGMYESKYNVYQSVWKDTVIELELIR
tara:strand:+ start:532 stop:759 length:228 start_codon:yes stop_codon:yes gene_type:complete